jgi:hypothetical protein
LRKNSQAFFLGETNFTKPPPFETARLEKLSYFQPVEESLLPLGSLLNKLTTCCRVRLCKFAHIVSETDNLAQYY